MTGSSVDVLVASLRAHGAARAELAFAKIVEVRKQAHVP